MGLGAGLHEPYTLTQLQVDFVGATAKRVEPTASARTVGTERRDDHVTTRRNRTIQRLPVSGAIVRIDKEVEHGSVAFDFYKAFYAKHEWYRRWMVLYAFWHILGETFKGYAAMVRAEGFYRKPLRALKAWKFFLSFGLDLAVAAFPVLSRKYHPRNHPICNEEQNRVAIAWREHIALGADPHSLTAGDVEQMLKGG